MKTLKSITLASLVTVISSAPGVFAASHTVKTGDTLWSLSQRYKVSVAEIQKANKLANSTIDIGQVIVIPEKNKKVTLAAPKKKITDKVGSYTVVKGDNLWRIARKYGVSVETLKKNNGLSSNSISIGQVIEISSKMKPEAKPTVKSAQKLAKPDKTKPAQSSSSKTEIPVSVPGVNSNEPVPYKDKSATTPATEPLPKVSANVPTSTEEKAVEAAEIPVVEKPTETPAALTGMAALTQKQQEAVRQQILLDRNGMGPGIIDGYPGAFTSSSVTLSNSYRPNALNEDTPLIVETTIPAEALTYINPNLPGSGKRPDFKVATKNKSLLMYKTSIEMLSERFHCSGKLLSKMNPGVDFSTPVVGTKILVPNVSEFKIEDFMTPAGKAISYKFVRKTRRATRVDIDYGMNRMMIWHNDELLASFPVTTNIKKGPKTERSILSISPAPVYYRKKTGLDLKPGPNSPVGIVWAKLGNGFGIHGTSDGSGNGYNTSSGCIRLSNWDMAIFVKIVPSKVKVNFLKNGVALKKAKGENLAKR